MLSYNAMMFARKVHADQRRRYTGNPYTDHLAEVAGIVAAVLDLASSETRDLMTATAWLHDCIEDQGVTVREIEREFGSTVAAGVDLLTCPAGSNRAERKHRERAQLHSAPGWVQTIKCADIISNTASIVEHDPRFAVTYLDEKRQLLPLLQRADARLWRLAMEQVERGRVSS